MCIRDSPVGAGDGESRGDAGERPGEPAFEVRNYRHAVGGVTLVVTVGVDENRPGLRPQPLEHVLDEWSPVQFDQSFVDATQARAAAAGEDEAGEGRESG